MKHNVIAIELHTWICNPVWISWLFMLCIEYVKSVRRLIKKNPSKQHSQINKQRQDNWGTVSLWQLYVNDMHRRCIWNVFQIKFEPGKSNDECKGTVLQFSCSRYVTWQHCGQEWKCFGQWWESIVEFCIQMAFPCFILCVFFYCVSFQYY